MEEVSSAKGSDGDGGGCKTRLLPGERQIMSSIHLKKTLAQCLDVNEFGLKLQLTTLKQILLMICYYRKFTPIFKASALWADAFYKSKCPYICVSVCLSVHF